MSATAQVASHFTSPDRPTWELYSVCIHCGLCLNQCPTYRILGTEMDSPRGRIYQVLQADAGRLAMGDSFVAHIDRCLGCRACETACPSGVEYGRIVERARAEIEANYRRPLLARWLRSYFFRRVLPDFRRLARLARLLRLYQLFGVEHLLRVTGVLKLLGLEQIARLSPRVDDELFFSELGRSFPAEGEKRARVALLAGCVASVAFAEMNRATIRVLTRNGVEVVIPANQACCGALAAHAGFRTTARDLAQRNLRAFPADDLDAILTNAAGCGATMKEYGDLIGNDGEGSEAQRFSAKVRDVTEFLAELGLREPVRRLEMRVTYQDACHLAHGQRVRSAPRELLQAAGAELIEMTHADHCCGSAGIYNVTQNELSRQILEVKMRDIASTEAQVIATANPGCTLQLRTGVRRAGLKMEVQHVMELLDACYR